MNVRRQLLSQLANQIGQDFARRLANPSDSFNCVCGERRRQLRARGIAAQIARQRTAHGSGLGKQRWVVERTISWLHQ